MPDPLVLPATYAIVTGDTTSGNTAVEDALADATALLEEKLERKLAEQELTERLLPDSEGRLYPTVTPIVSAPGFTVYGDVIVGGPFWTSPGFTLYDPRAQVTYTGGYVERSANPTAANILPKHVEIDLCWAAYTLLHPAELAAIQAAPAGASSRSVGDASVTLKQGAPDNPSDVLASTWSRDTLRLGRVRRRL